MPTMQRILHATDFSEQSAAATRSYVLILAMLAVAYIGGPGAMGIMRAHSQLIKEFALPFWQ